MRSRAILALGLVLLAGAAGAQTGAETPDVPAGEATIRGRVVRAEAGAPAAGVEVVLYALPASAPPGVRRTVSDDEGRFVFASIDHDPATTYLVGARYQGVSYPGARVQFAAGEREHEVEVRVHEVTPETAGLALRELRMRLDWLGDRIDVSEVLAVANPGPSTVFVPPDRRAGHAPAAEVELPAGAHGLTGPLGLVPEGVEQKGRELRWFGPVFPGSGEVDYVYEVPAAAGTLRLERQLPAQPVQVTLQVPASGPEVLAPGLTAGDPTVVAGRGYKVFSGPVSGRLALEIQVPAARHDPGAVSLAEVRILGELDAAAFVAREEHVIEVKGDAPVLADDDEPLLAISLPTGASDLRFGAPESGARLVPLPDGSGLGVLGPLSPGETVLEVRYRIPAGDGPFTLVRRFAERVPLLSVYLADTGNLRVESARLHRRRPARTTDRTYLHLEGFEIAPQEEVSVQVATFPPHRELPRAATVLFVALAAGAAALVLAGPLRRPGGGSLGPEDEVESAAQREREALTASLRDLEHDFETGKLVADDYAQLRDDLRSRALGLLQEERSAAARPPAPPAGPGLCPGCGHRPGPDDRFCARCGRSLAS
jgi:5-hydroxyisourate hydrolase-like protein (transthyretin family)